MTNKEGASISDKSKPELTQKWGTSEAKWWADHEDESILVILQSGKEIKGYLMGVDHYTITIEESETGNKFMIFKHSIESVV